MADERDDEDKNLNTQLVAALDERFVRRTEFETLKTEVEELRRRLS